MILLIGALPLLVCFFDLSCLHQWHWYASVFLNQLRRWYMQIQQLYKLLLIQFFCTHGNFLSMRSCCPARWQFMQYNRRPSRLCAQIFTGGRWPAVIFISEYNMVGHYVLSILNPYNKHQCCIQLGSCYTCVLSQLARPQAAIALSVASASIGQRSPTIKG